MTAVDGMYSDFTEILSFLEQSGEITWRSVSDENFKKVLLIAAASHFEQSMMSAVVRFAAFSTKHDHPLKWFVEKKAVARQYHTWFDWRARNVNQFFGLFGDPFKNHITSKITSDGDLETAIHAFLEIGHERNRLVHQDFGTYSLEKTFEEIFRLYDKARKFVEWFPNELNAYTTESADIS